MGREGITKFLIDFSPKTLATNALMGFLLFSWVLGLILGCAMTLTAHADVLFSSSGVYILFFAIITCQYVHKYEIFGYLIFAIGVLIMLTDPFAMKEGENNDKFLGDLISFSTAFFGA
mmetsp:Transcript_5961/g.5120  ORF Transcript_5961/g.5120 Transcript_5961/m.5120 type:complete len:118 (+) Transcript_5961:409-762(+)